MKKWLKTALSQNSLRKALGFVLFFRGAKFNHHLEILDSLSFQRVLVLSPHPDDDIFGLGGTMTKLITNGAEVTVVYFCDGSGGVPEIRNSKSETRDNGLIEIRRNEAKEAAKILKITDQVFFGHKDGQLNSSGVVKKAFSDLKNRVKPDIIFVPSFLDNHPDHRAVNQILLESMILEDRDLPVWAYEVWTPILVNRIVNITDVIEVKKTAMSTQKSQLQARNYDKAILGLNQYRAEINGQKGYAEGFFATTMEIYKKMYSGIV